MDTHPHTSPTSTLTHAGCDHAAIDLLSEPSHIHIPRPSRLRQAVALIGSESEALPTLELDLSQDELALEPAA